MAFQVGSTIRSKQILQSVVSQYRQNKKDWKELDNIKKTGILIKLYGYQHPPRAARDVRELGIPLVTFRIKSSDGRSIGAYKFGNVHTATDVVSKAHGRTALSNALKKH